MTSFMPRGALGFRMVPRVIPCPAEFAVDNGLVAGSVGVDGDGTISCAWIEHRRVEPRVFEIACRRAIDGFAAQGGYAAKLVADWRAARRAIRSPSPSLGFSTRPRVGVRRARVPGRARSARRTRRRVATARPPDPDPPADPARPSPRAAYGRDGWDA